MCEWCYQNPMEPKKTKEEEDVIEDQIDDAREAVHHNHNR